MAHISHLRHLSLPVLFFIYINIVFADPRAIHIFRRDDSTGVSSTATDASTSQPGTSSQPTTTEADPTSQPVIFTSTTSSSISDSSTSTSSLTSSSISAVISNINGATPTNTINSDIYNATLTPNKLPLTPEITPGSAVAGVILLLTGIVYTLIGIKNKWLHISLSAAYLSSLAVTVLIVYVMNPPVSHAVQGAYVVAIVLTGCILGAASLAFTEMTEGLGCILGGFSLSMWLLVLKPGGLVTSTSGKAALISTLTFAVFATSFTHYSRPYGLIVSLSFGGATVIILGIDCFSRAGLKEFWAYIWNLNDNLFPVGATTYPMTKGIKVEIAAIVILFLAGIVSQMKLWKVIKENRERRASERLEDERTMQQEEENVGNRIERHNARERSQWEAVYGDKDRLKASINSNRDSGVTDLDSQKKGPTSTITSVRRSREDGIEMSGIPSPTVPTAAGLIIPNSQQDGLKVTIQVGRDLEPPKDVQGQSADRLSQISQKSLQQDESVWVVGEDSEARLERRPLQNNSKRASCNSKAPDVVPLPFKIPDEDGEDGQSSVATFADEDHPGSKRNSRHISSGSNFLQKLSKISYKDSKRFSKDEGVSTEDLVLPQANDDDRASSIAATMDGLSDDEDVKSVQSSLGLNREVNEGRADGQSEQRELKDKETVPAEEPIVPTVEDQTRPVIKPSLTSSTDPTPAVIEKESQKDDSNTTGKPNQTTSIASILDSGTSTSITTQRLPPPPPRVVTSYRTNEWAKHLSSAETPDIEELKIDSPMESTSVEAVAPVNVDALQETPENNLLPPASISVSHISNYPPRASTLQSKISQRSSSINIDATTACSSSQQSPQRQPSQQSINTRSAAFRSSSHFFPPAIAESPIEEDQVPASFNAYNANKINTFGPTSTLMGKRDTMLRTKPSFQNNSSVLPPTAEAVDVSRSVSDSGSIYNLPDDDNMSLAARRNLIRQSSLQTNSLQPGPVAFDSHQPKRQSSAPHPLERESKLASFRANVQEELKSSIQPRKSIERQRSALLLGRQAEEQRRAFNAMMKGSRDNEFTERMRRGDMLDAHREALRKMQASANKHTYPEQGPSQIHVEQREHLSSLPSDLTGTLSTSTILPTSQHPKGGESRQGSVATESHAGPSTITNPTSTIKRSNASGAAPPYPLSNPPPTNSTTLPGPNIQVTSPTRWSLRNALIGAGNSDTHASPFRSRAATGASIGSYRLRRPSAARLWNPTNSTPRISPGQQKPRSRRRPRSSAEERPVIAVPLSHPDIDKPREGANAGGEYPLLTLPEQRQSRHLGSTRGSLQVERTGSPSGSNRISLPRSVSIDLQRKKSESPTSPALDKGKGRAIDDDDPPLETQTTILRVPSRSSGSQPPTPRIIIGFDSDKGKGKETMADLERGPETQIPYAPGGNSSIPNPNNASHASLQSGLGPALSQTNSSIEGEEINAEEEWGPHHPCFPHMNPHVPLSSSLYQTTRIIRINRDWMIEGDLAPTFSNLYPEILDPAGVSEQEFRRIIEKVNSELIPAHNPWSLRNIFDGFMGVMTGWIWDDLGLTDVKGRLRKVEAFLEDWNQEMERKSRESGMAPKIVSLRRTGYMNLDIQVPDPEISYPASGTEEERTNTGASHTSGQHPQ